MYALPSAARATSRVEDTNQQRDPGGGRNAQAASVSARTADARTEGAIRATLNGVRGRSRARRCCATSRSGTARTAARRSPALGGRAPWVEAGGVGPIRRSGFGSGLSERRVLHGNRDRWIGFAWTHRRKAKAMSRVSICLAIAATVGLAGPVCAQPAAPSGRRAGPKSPPAMIARAAPALKIGAIVTDRTGARLGPIQSLTEAARGPMAVILLDGKLVSVPQSTLTLKGEGAVSSQTKAEIFAAAGAPS
jgi:hypothetical protein